MGMGDQDEIARPQPLSHHLMIGKHSPAHEQFAQRGARKKGVDSQNMLARPDLDPGDTQPAEGQRTDR